MSAHSEPSGTTGIPWNALLAELPPHATPQRRAVAPPEILSRPEGRAVAGWDQLIVELPAGDEGLRTVLVVLDAHDQVVSVSDAVLRRVEHAVERSLEPPIERQLQRTIEREVDRKVEYEMGRELASDSDSLFAPRGDSPHPKGMIEYRHESLGGRFERDGKFHGARWRVVTREDGSDDDAPLDSSSSEPSEEELSALHALIREVVRRAPPRVS